MTQIIIEFDSDELEHVFIEEIKERMKYSQWKPKNLKMTITEETKEMQDKMTQIIIEFDSDDFEHHFIKDLKEKMEYSDCKPQNPKMTITEEIT